MHTKNFLVNDGSDGQAVEAVRESFPQLDIVSSFTLITKSVNSVDGCTLVVASEQKEIFWVLDLVRQQQTNGL